MNSRFSVLVISVIAVILVFPSASSSSAQMQSTGASQTIKPAGSTGGGNSQSLTLTANLATGKLSIGASIFDVGQQINFTLELTSTGSPDNYGADILVSGAGVSPAWHNYSNVLFSYFNVTPITSGTLYWNMTVHDFSNGFQTSGGRSTPVNTDPSGSITVASSSSTVTVGQNVTLKLSSTVGGGTQPYNASWFENGVRILTGTGLNSSYFTSFTSSGNYTFYVKAFDYAGFGPITSNSVTVHVLKLFADVSSSIPTSDAGQSVVFSTVIGGFPAYSLTMKIFDGSSTSDPVLSSTSSLNISYTFNVAGDYLVQAIAVDTQNSQFTATGSVIQVVNSDPSVTASSNTSITDAGVPVRFSSFPEGGTGSYNITWMLSGSAISYAQDFNYSFASPGNYTLKADVRDTNGLTATSSVSIEVAGSLTFSFSNSSNPTASKRVWFNASIHGGTGPYSVTWTFSGFAVTGQDASYIFSSAGIYAFTVRVTDGVGTSVSENGSIDVRLFVSISASPETGTAPLSVTFGSSVLGGQSYAYDWNFGNGNTSASPEPAEVFTEGNYSVTLNVRDGSGDTGSADIAITSLPPPVSVTFSPNAEITVLTPVTYEAIPAWYVAGPFDAHWTFQGNSTIEGMNVTYTFHSYAAKQDANLLFTYGNSSFVVSFSVLMVPAAPIVSVQGLADIVPLNTILAVSAANSSSPDASITSISWSFEGSNYSGITQYFDFNRAGNVTLKVTVKDSLFQQTSKSYVVDVENQQSSSSIQISAKFSSSPPIDQYLISVHSPGGISAVEAFLGSVSLNVATVNQSSEDGNYSITLDERNYNPGTYEITIIAYSNTSQSNTVIEKYVIGTQYSGGIVATLQGIVSDVGGTFDFLLIVMTAIGTGGTLIALRRKNPPEIVELNGQPFAEKSGNKGFRLVGNRKKR